MTASLTFEQNSLVVRTKYDEMLVAQIKALPATDRKWDPQRKAWLIAPQHGKRVADWIAQYLGELVMVPQIRTKMVTDLRTLEVRYIGTCKERGGEWSAFGWVKGEWSAVFPEAVLREWFEGKPAAPGHTEATTLYGVLGIPQSADADQIKTAYRRMARTWHPDVCREPDAEERFKRINEAYQVISNPNLRARYDAGMALESTLSKTPDQGLFSKITTGYRSPLLCGLILAEGIDQLGRFIVSKVVLWEEIHNSLGQTLVTSWPAGAQRPFETWINP